MKHLKKFENFELNRFEAGEEQGSFEPKSSREDWYHFDHPDEIENVQDEEEEFGKGEEQVSFEPKNSREDWYQFDHPDEIEDAHEEEFGREEADLDEDGEECEECGGGDEEVKDWNDAQTLERVKSFGSFLNEEKKFSAAQLAAQKKFKERAKGKKSDDKEEDKKAKKGSKPDFLDLDKDGDKKEPMKKAAKEAKEKKEETGKKDEPIKKVNLKERILKSQGKK